MIEEASAREQSLIDQGKRVIVGVNKYKLITKTKPMYLRSTT